MKVGSFKICERLILWWNRMLEAPLITRGETKLPPFMKLKGEESIS
jgi:hypothetical protein